MFVIVLANSTEIRKRKRGTLAFDLRESGSIEQDADAVMLWANTARRRHSGNGSGQQEGESPEEDFEPIQLLLANSERANPRVDLAFQKVH